MRPDDNFTLEVVRQHGLLGGVVCSSQVSLGRRDLAPASLLPPSYAFLPQHSAGSDDDDTDESGPQSQTASEVENIESFCTVHSSFLGSVSAESGDHCPSLQS